MSRLPKTFLTQGEGSQGSPSAHPRECSRMYVRPKLPSIRAGTAVAMQHFFRGFPPWSCGYGRNGIGFADCVDP